MRECMKQRAVREDRQHGPEPEQLTTQHVQRGERENRKGSPNHVLGRRTSAHLQLATKRAEIKDTCIGPISIRITNPVCDGFFCAEPYIEKRFTCNGPQGSRGPVAIALDTTGVMPFIARTVDHLVPHIEVGVSVVSDQMVVLRASLP